MNALRVSCITIATIALPCVFIRFFLLPMRTSISCDWFLSSHVKKTLETYPLPKTIFGVSRFIDETLDEIPALKTVQAHIPRYKMLHITAHGHRPWLQINTDHVLTRDGFVLPAYFFDKEHLTTLASIHADQNALEIDAFNADLFTFLTNIPQEILYEAHITWHNKTFITIALPAVSPVIIIAHHASIFTEKIMHLLDTIAKEKNTQNRTPKKTYADIRFKNQIILSYKKEEAA